MAPEEIKLESEPQKEIDQKLISVGWVIQDKNKLNLYEKLGISVCEMKGSGNRTISRDKLHKVIPGATDRRIYTA